MDAATLTAIGALLATVNSIVLGWMGVAKLKKRKAEKRSLAEAAASGPFKAAPVKRKK